MKILAIDYGSKRLGFAVGDTELYSAAPLKQVDRKREDLDIDHIKALIAAYEVEKLVIGYPLNMDGTKSDTARQVEEFGQLLQNRTKLPVDYVDERLTSFEAEEMLKEYQADYRKRKRALDSISALVILRTHLEECKNR